MLMQNIEPAEARDPTGEPVIRIAVCGKVSSGKSTVLNAMMRDRILPDNIGRTNRPIVVLGHRPESGGQFHYSDGSSTEFSGRADSAQFDETTQLHLWSDHKHLSGFEFVEIPMTKAEELTSEQIALVASCDLLIWVTIASQAWRLTEKTILEHLQEVRPQNAILAVTRADNLRNKSDQIRLRERLFHETSHLFNDHVLIHGAPSKLLQSAKSEALWSETGGAEILSSISQISDSIRALKSGAAVTDPKTEMASRGAVFHRSKRPDNHPAPGTPEPTEMQAMPDARCSDLVALTVTALTNQIKDMTGVLAAGLIPQDAEKPVIVEGSAQEAKAASALAHAVIKTYDSHFSDNDGTAVESFHLALQSRRVLFSALPERGVLYIVADAGLMTQGLAQTCLARLSKGITAPT